MISLKGIWQAVRPGNLVIILATFYLMRSLQDLEVLSVNTHKLLSFCHFSLLAISITLLAAAGNVINDIQDVEADVLNRPLSNPVNRILSSSDAWRAYWILNALGLGLGFFILLAEMKLNLFPFHIGIAISLWLYSKHLQMMPWLGNITIAILCGIIPPLSLWYGRMNAMYTFEISEAILFYGGLAFMITLIRELVKDVVDVPGDKEAGYRTAAIVCNKEYLRIIVLLLIGLTLLLEAGLLLFFMQFTTDSLWIAVFALLLFLPLLFSAFIWNFAQSLSDYHRLTSALKWTLVFGLGSSMIFHFL